MKDKLKHLYNYGQGIRLSDKEKSALRAGLIGHMSAPSAIKPFAIKNAFETASSSRPTSFVFSLWVRYATATLTLFVFLGGISFAAEYALPGNILYPIKINVNEELRSLTGFSSEDRAGWEAKRAERRLREAQELALLGRLEGDVREELESRFETHLKNARKNISQIRIFGQLEEANQIASSFESALRAHRRVLARIEEVDEEKRINDIGTFSFPEIEEKPLVAPSRIDRSLEELSELRANLEEEMRLGDRVHTKEHVQAKIKEAQDILEQAKKSLDLAKGIINESVISEIEIEIQIAKKVFEWAKEHAEEENNTEAIIFLQEVARRAQETQVSLKTRQRLKLDLVPELDKESLEETDSATGQESNETADLTRNAETESKTLIESESGTSKEEKDNDSSLSETKTESDEETDDSVDQEIDEENDLSSGEAKDKILDIVTSRS